MVKNLRNGTLVITRSDAGTNLISKVQNEDLIKLYSFNESQLVKMHWHNLRFKKYGLSPFLSFLHFVFSSKIAKNFAPFRFLTMLSKFRRKFSIGISVDLHEVEQNSFILPPKN